MFTRGDLSGLAESESTRRALELVRLYSRVTRPIVFLGPVGVGKTTLAREVLTAARLRGRFVVVGSGELGEKLFEDALFGHVMGAYTDASSSRRGAFAEAADGALLIDDLPYMHHAAQAAILRVMESGIFRPLGSEKEERARCRILFASTVDLDELVADGRLVQDLKSRMGELVIRIPPLRERREDILPIARRYARAVLREMSLHVPVDLTPSAATALECYDWPENVRELKGVIEYAVLHAGVVDDAVTIHIEHLPARLWERRSPKQSVHRSDQHRLIELALRQSGGNQSEAARSLGVHRNTIGRYVRKKR